MTKNTLNYTVVAVGIIAIFSLTSWVVWAHRWFVGPVRELEEAAALGVDITVPGELEKAEAKLNTTPPEKEVDLDEEGRA